MLRTGRCLCGDISFTATGEVEGVTLCHCSMCRKWSGNVTASFSIPLDRLEICGTPVWYRSSAHARRGFCGRCGSSLFWEPLGGGRMAVSAGALDLPTGLTVIRDEEPPADFERPGPLPDEPKELTGSCLCGAVTARLPGPAGAVEACHCTRCRRMSGHYTASFGPVVGAVFSGAALRHHDTPEGGRWSFCGSCGSTVGFGKDGEVWIDAGFIDPPTGGRLTGHIFTAFKGDYYEISDGLPQSAER